MKLASSVIPRRTLLPDDVYRFKVEKYEDKPLDDGRKRFNSQLRVLEPETAKGLVHFEGFLLGTKEDPEAKDPETQKKTGTNLVNFLEACGFDLTEDVDTDAVDPVGCEFIAQTKQKVGKDKKADGSVNPYAGQVSVSVQRYWKADDKKAPAPGTLTRAAAEASKKTAAAENAKTSADPKPATETPAGDTIADE